MNYQCDEAKLSAAEIAEIHRNMEIKGLSHVYCQACSEEMKPEQARKSATGLIMCRPCYMCNETDATQAEIDQALEEDFRGYLASFNNRCALGNPTEFKIERSALSRPPAKNDPTPTPSSNQKRNFEQRQGG